MTKNLIKNRIVRIVIIDKLNFISIIVYIMYNEVICVKRLLSFLLVIFILLINIFPCYAANANLSVGVSDYYVDKGEKITVSIKLSANSELATLSISANYNPAEFEYVAGSGKVSGIFSEETFTPSNSGRLKFRGVSTEPVTAGGTVVSFQLLAVGYGGMISLNVSEAVDVEGNAVTVTKSSVKLSCAHGLMNWTVTQEPSCVLYGKKEGVCGCGHSEKVELKPNDAHSFDKSTVITKPTCTKTGLEVGTCTACGKSGAQTVIPALEHQFSDWKVTKEADVGVMGIKERTCKTCKEKEVQMVPAVSGVDIPVTEYIPIESTTAPTTAPSETQTNYNNYYEIETEPTTEGKQFLGATIEGSNVVLVAVTGLTVLIVGFLLSYLLLLRRR